MIVSLIVAADEKNGIGKDNALMWRLPNDLRFFKLQTSGHCVVMGRKTFESLKSPLSNRTNIVVTRQADYEAPGCTVIHDLGLAIKEADKLGEDECFVIGGGQIFEEILGRADKIYFTRVHHTFDAEVFFPEFDWNDWEITFEEHHEPDEKHAYPYTFYILKRKMVM